MRYDRRTLLRRGALLAGASSVAGGAGYVSARELARGDEEPAAGLPSSTEAEDARLFALDRRYTNLTTFLLASHPKPVRDAIARHRARLDANPALYLREAETGLEEAARSAAASYLAADPDTVALTDSTTMGLGLVYGGLRLERGDEVLTTEHDFYATHESLRLREERDGVRVRRVRLYDEPESASVDGMVEAIGNSLGRRTRCLAVTWVHSSSGVKLPLRAIADAVARENGARPDAQRILLCVDGVHGLGVEDESPLERGADVFVSGCHKWLFGPRGTGVIAATPFAWTRLAPTIPTFDPRAYLAWIEGRRPTETPPGRLMTPGGFHSFEHRWALADVFGVHEQLGGRARVAARTHALALRLKQGLARIPGVEVKTPAEEALSAGLVCATFGGTPPPDVVDRLREEHRVLASVTPYATPYVRFGPSVANSEEDVDRALEAVTAIAGR
ncbi:MAG: aminotransferase class V-fold PLP-dependent enzyme [Thermoleophilia bacterium]|nr:aminotransferase class V-fold PLP-dependent enzyme [Thermoleophilia bacterium]